MKEKPAMSISPFTVLIDTREQKPWKFQRIPMQNGSGVIVVETKWHCLGTGNGDYSIDGVNNPDGSLRLSIERKSPDDFFETVISRRKNFEAELENLNDMEYSAVIVEKDFHTLLDYTPLAWKNVLQLPHEAAYHRRKRIFGSFYAWQLRFERVRWYFVPRSIAPLLAYRLMERFWKERLQ